MIYDQNILIDRIKQKELEFLNNTKNKTESSDKDKKVSAYEQDDLVTSDE